MSAADIAHALGDARRAAINLPTTGTIPEPCSIISATGTSSTPSDTPSFHPTGSGTSGEISVDRRPSSAPRVSQLARLAHRKPSLDVRAADATPGRGDYYSHQGGD
jgi:hypothetical protein